MTNELTRMQHKYEALRTRANSMTSIVSYPERHNAWGDAKYRGNCDGRLFLSLLLRYSPKKVADPMMGSGTTRDVVNWLNGTAGTQIDFWGSDLRHQFNLQSEHIPGEHDFVWIHPPYWNIIRYSNHPSDLSTCDDYHRFNERLTVCLWRCYAALRPGGRLAILVGDIRKRGRYISMARDVLNLEGEIGELKSIIIKAQHNCKSDSIAYKQFEDVRIGHEYCLVFQRPK